MKLEWIETIDVNAKEWFDKKNGNSYFAGIVTLNYGKDTQREYLMPMQYGYGSQYEYEAKYLLTEFNCISGAELSTLSSFCRDNNIILRTNKEENCRKRDLLQIHHDYDFNVQVSRKLKKEI